MEQAPRSSDDTLGRRRFQLSREQAVEKAVEKIRHAPSAAWETFSDRDYAALRGLLEELWEHIGRERWEDCSFATITREDIRDLLSLGAGAVGRPLSQATLGEMAAVLERTCHRRDEQTGSS